MGDYFPGYRGLLLFQRLPHRYDGPDLIDRRDVGSVISSRYKKFEDPADARAESSR